MSEQLSTDCHFHTLTLPGLSLIVSGMALSGKRKFREDVSVSGGTLVTTQGNRMHHLTLTGQFDLATLCDLTLTLEGYLSQNTSFSFVLCGMEFQSMQIGAYALREDAEHACGSFELTLLSADATIQHVAGGEDA